MEKGSDVDVDDYEDTASENQSHSGEEAKLYKCPNCKKSFQLITKYHEHLRSHLVYYPYECKECHECFSQKVYLQEHLQVHVQQKKSFTCSQCSETFSNFFGLNRHLLEHSRDAPYPCPVCDEPFLTVHSRSTHMKNHVINCGLCRIPFQSQRHLGQHIFEVHRSKNVNEKPIPINPIQEDLFSSSGEDDEGAINPCSEDLQCFVCEQHLSSRDDYNIHLKAHRVFLCSFCPQFFSHPSQLRQHNFKRHGNNPFKCEVCSLEFINALEFKLHQQSCKKENNVGMDSMFPSQDSFTERLESCSTPIFDLNRDSHFIWLSDFAKRLKSVKYPLDDHTLKQILHVYKTLVETLHHPSGELLKSEKFFYVLNVQHELSTMVTEHLKHLSKLLP